MDDETKIFFYALLIGFLSAAALTLATYPFEFNSQIKLLGHGSVPVYIEPALTLGPKLTSYAVVINESDFRITGYSMYPPALIGGGGPGAATE